MLIACLITALTSPASFVVTGFNDSANVKLNPLYVGLQVGSYRFAGLGQTDAKGKQLTYRGAIPIVGFHLTARSSIEVAAMWRRPTNGAITVEDYSNGGKYRYYDSYKSCVIPILYRYSLLKKANRWNIEGIAGVSWLHSRIEGHRSITEAGQSEQPFAVSGFTEANDLPLALGMSLEYTPSEHWTVVGEGRLNWSVLGSAATAVLFGDVFMPQHGTGLSLRYNFGL